MNGVPMSAAMLRPQSNSKPKPCEDGWVTEMIYGHQELIHLGLILFSQFARDVKHIEISGYSYISFLI